MTALLTPEDLEELTGAKRPSKQRRALDQAGIRYVIRIDGAPSTTWDAVNAALAGQRPRSDNAEEPNLEFLRGPKARHR